MTMKSYVVSGRILEILLAMKSMSPCVPGLDTIYDEEKLVFHHSFLDDDSVFKDPKLQHLGQDTHIKAMMATRNLIVIATEEQNTLGIYSYNSMTGKANNQTCSIPLRNVRDLKFNPLYLKDYLEYDVTVIHRRVQKGYPMNYMGKPGIVITSWKKCYDITNVFKDMLIVPFMKLKYVMSEMYKIISGIVRESTSISESKYQEFLDVRNIHLKDLKERKLVLFKATELTFAVEEDEENEDDHDQDPDHDDMVEDEEIPEDEDIEPQHGGF